MVEPVRLVDRRLAPSVLRAALEAGCTPLQARVVAGRLRDADAGRLTRLLKPGLGVLDPPGGLPDIDVAAEAVADAIVSARPIVLLSDYDCDGASAHAVLKLALRDHFGVPEALIHSYIGHRLRDGYGVTESVTRRIIESAPSPALLITADQGSTDEARIALLRAHGIATVVTDHHGLPPAGAPLSAIACVNPVRVESAYGDPCIAGVHVAWLLCCAVRQQLVSRGVLPRDAPKLGGLLDLVALGTMADCVDMGRSANNRAVLAHGLALMNRPGARPAWAALARAVGADGPITAATLGYSFGPMINARGRLDCALGAVDLLLSDDSGAADAMARQLAAHNGERKQVQARMMQRAWPIAEAQACAGHHAITVFDREGHPGVHGICAARLVEATGRPVAYFSPKAAGSDLTASLRGVPGFHVRQALAEMAERHPEDFVAWGGHAGAGGVTLRADGLDRFRRAFDAIAVRERRDEAPGPCVWVDGELGTPPSLDLVNELATLEPYGRQWESPVFRGSATVREVRPVGDGSHLKLVLEMDGERRDAIWFGAVRDGVQPVQAGHRVTLAYELDANTYREQTRLQLRVRHAAVEPAPPASNLPGT